MYQLAARMSLPPEHGPDIFQRTLDMVDCLFSYLRSLCVFIEILTYLNINHNLLNEKPEVVIFIFATCMLGELSISQVELHFLPLHPEVRKDQNYFEFFIFCKVKNSHVKFLLTEIWVECIQVEKFVMELVKYCNTCSNKI